MGLTILLCTVGYLLIGLVLGISYKFLDAKRYGWRSAQDINFEILGIIIAAWPMIAVYWVIKETLIKISDAVDEYLEKKYDK